MGLHHCEQLMKLKPVNLAEDRFEFGVQVDYFAVVSVLKSV
jgi:hypothetical protein